MKNNRKKVMILTNHSYMLYRFRKELIEELMKNYDVVLSMPFVGHHEDFINMGLRCIETKMERRGVNPIHDFLLMKFCNGVQREHNKKLNNGLPILHKVPPKRDYGRYFCIMAEKGGTSHGGLTEKLSLFFHAKKQEVNAYGR